METATEDQSLRYLAIKSSCVATYDPNVCRMYTGSSWWLPNASHRHKDLTWSTIGPSVDYQYATFQTERSSLIFKNEDILHHFHEDYPGVYVPDDVVQNDLKARAVDLNLPCWRCPWNYSSSSLGKAVVSLDTKARRQKLVSLLMFASGKAGDEICYIIIDDIGYLAEEDARDKLDRLRINNSFASDIEFGNPIRQVLHYSSSPFSTEEDLFVVNCGAAIYFIRGRFLYLRQEEVMIRLECEDSFAVTVSVACQDQVYDFALLDLDQNLTIYRFTSTFNAYHKIHSLSLNYMLQDSPFTSWQLALDFDVTVMVKSHLTVFQYHLIQEDINVVWEASARELFIQILPLDQVPSTFAFLSDTTLLVYSSTTGQKLRREHYLHLDSRPFLRSINSMGKNLLILCSSMDSLLTIYSFSIVQGIMSWDGLPISLKVSNIVNKEIFSAEVKPSKTSFGRAEHECLIFHSLDLQTLSTQVLIWKRDESLSTSNGDIETFKRSETNVHHQTYAEGFLRAFSTKLMSYPPEVPKPISSTLGETPESTRIGRLEPRQAINQTKNTDLNSKPDYSLRDLSDQFTPLALNARHVTNIDHFMNILNELKAQSGFIYHLTPNLESEPATSFDNLMQIFSTRYLGGDKDELLLESSERSQGLVQMLLHEGLAAYIIQLNHPDTPILPTLSKYTSHRIPSLLLSHRVGSILKSWPTTTTTTTQLPPDLATEEEFRPTISQRGAPAIVKRKEPTPARKKRRTIF